MPSRRASIISAFLILTMLSTSCQSPTDLRLTSAEEYSELNDYILNSEKVYGIIQDSATLADPNAQLVFAELQSEGKLLHISDHNKDIVYYKIKHEKVKPSSGIGIQYYSHYLIYTSLVKPDFQMIFKENYELEEIAYGSEEISEKWYYVIGKHSSD